MAKLTGLLELEGTFGDITFVKTKNGIIVRKKSSISASRIAKDKCFQRTRQNNAEFSTAAKGTKLLRLTIDQLLRNAKDGRTANRLLSAMMKVVKSDMSSARGERNITDGDISQLENFECNINSSLLVIFKSAYETVVDRVSGTLRINIPAFVPKKSVAMPEGATHFKLVTAGVEIDFENEAYNVSTSDSDMIECEKEQVNALTFSNSIPAGSAHTLFILMGVQFFNKVNGKFYPVQKRELNALCIVKTSNALYSDQQ
jgi:hypothetical protein